MKISVKIREMIEIWRMWKLMGFFKKNQHMLVDYAASTQALLEASDTDYQRLLKAAIAMSDPNEGRVNRIHLLNAYLGKNKSFLERKSRRLPEMAHDVRSLINGCLEKGFLKPDDKNKVYITLDGRQFCGISGLLREWALYLQPLGLASVIAGVWAIVEASPHILNLIRTGQW